MANPNNPANANMYAANNAAANNGLNGMPAAGHYSDMQALMQNMETLSGWLQQNREDFLRVQEGLEAVERRNVGLSLPHTGQEMRQACWVRGMDEDISSNARFSRRLVRRWGCLPYLQPAASMAMLLQMLHVRVSPSLLFSFQCRRVTS